MESLIKCYAIHLPSRQDRRLSVISEFEGKDDILLEIFPAVEHTVGAVSLWLSIKEVIRKVVKEDFFILCEDDHIFTPNYSGDALRNCLKLGESLGADIISGGVSWFKTGVQISNNLFWIQKFSGLQFTIIFNRFFDRILNASFTKNDQADYKISALSNKKFVYFPFISVQKDFGYSDITHKNNDERRVEKLFFEAEERLNFLKHVSYFYKNISSTNTNAR